METYLAAMVGWPLVLWAIGQALDAVAARRQRARATTDPPPRRAQDWVYRLAGEDGRQPAFLSTLHSQLRDNPRLVLLPLGDPEAAGRAVSLARLQPGRKVLAPRYPQDCLDRSVLALAEDEAQPLEHVAVDVMFFWPVVAGRRTWRHQL